MSANKNSITAKEVQNYQQSLFTTATGETFTVINLRADATGGYFKTNIDEKSAFWEAPMELKIISYEAKDIDHGGDYKYNISEHSDNRIDAAVWAKGHPKGERNNHSWIEIEVLVVVENRTNFD